MEVEPPPRSEADEDMQDAPALNKRSKAASPDGQHSKQGSPSKQQSSKKQRNSGSSHAAQYGTPRKERVSAPAVAPPALPPPPASTPPPPDA
jgi:hypothetical protein